MEDNSNLGSNEENKYDEEYTKETNLAVLIGRVGTASTRSFANKVQIVRKKVPMLSKPVSME